MLRFKQYLIENNNSDDTGIKIGEYSISPMDALSNRLGSPQKALDYLELIKQRRSQHSSEIDPQWVLPSLESEDYSEKLKVGVRPGRRSGEIGVAPSTIIANKENNAINYRRADGQDVDIIINTNAYHPNPDGMEAVKKDLTKTSNELQATGQYKKDTGALSDSLWHELQHVLQFKGLKKHNRPASDMSAQGYDYSSKDPKITPQMSTYATSPVELPAHMSENKMRFYEASGILLDPNFTDDHFEKYKGWLKNDQNKQSRILLQLFDDPKKGKQAKELLRQIAQTNKRNNGEMMA
jgi:hypothetical protein